MGCLFPVRSLCGVEWKPFGLVFKLGDTLNLDTWKLPPEYLGAVRFLDVVGSFFHEGLFVDPLEVIGCGLISMLWVIAQTNAASAHPPDHALGLCLCRFDLLVHSIASETHLVEGQGIHLGSRAKAHDVAVLTLYFRHEVSSPAEYRQVYQ